MSKNVTHRGVEGGGWHDEGEEDEGEDSSDANERDPEQRVGSGELPEEYETVNKEDQDGDAESHHGQHVQAQHLVQTRHQVAHVLVMTSMTF